jgi:hypothetical protein
MKYWKTKSTGLVLVIALLVSLLPLIRTPIMAQEDNTLYFNPNDISLCHGRSVETDLMAEIDAQNPVIRTLITFTFDNTCIVITDAVGNTADWSGGVTIPDLDWINEHGSLTISATVG